MCLGPTHATAGLTAGVAADLYWLHLPPGQAAVFLAVTTGAAVLPDLDHPNSTMAHSFGFLTKAIATVIGTVSGGHRKLTHSILGTALFWLAAWAGVHWRHDLAGRIGLAVLLALILSSGLCILPKIKSHITDVAAVGLAAWMAVSGTGLALVAVATVLGCAAHVVLGDMFTDSGCPLAYPLSKRRQKWVPEPISFTTGTRPEAAFAFVLLLALGFLAYHALTVTHHVI